MRQVSGLGGGKVRGYGKNLGTKLIAVLLALMLWLFVFGQQTPTNTPEFTRTLTNIPVEILGADRDFQYLLTPPNVDIVIRGTQEFINSMVGREHRVTVDVRGLEEGIHNIEVATGIAGGVVQNIRPSYVTVVVDPIITQEFEVTVQTIGTLSENVNISDLVVRPETVSLTGPKGELERVSSVIATLDLSQITQSQQVTVPINPVDIYKRNVNSLQLNISNVIIEVAVENRTIERELTLRYINIEEGLLATLSQNTVKAVFPANINPENINPYVNLEGLSEGTHTITVRSEVNGVVFVPEQIQVVIERE